MAANRDSPASVSSQAPENNQRLFRRYGKIFAQNDLPAYISHAQKLSVWLRDHKAYYGAARPEIVKLLLIAQITLRRALGIDQQPSVPFKVSDYPGNPMVEAYTMLIKSVEPFQTLFTEPGLIVHIKALMATMTMFPSPSSTVLSQIPFAPPTRDGVIVGDNPSKPMNAPPKPDPEVEIIERPHNMSAISQTQASDAKGVPTSSTVSSGKAKVKKRKTIDFNLLVEHDIKGLMQKKGSQSVQPPTSVSSPEIVPKASTPSVDPLSTSGATLTGPIAIPTETGSIKPTSTQLNDKAAKEEKIEISLINGENMIISTDNTTSVDQQMKPSNTASLPTEEHAMDMDERTNVLVADQVDLPVPGDEATMPSTTIQPMDVSGDSNSTKSPEGQHTSRPPEMLLPSTKEPTPMDVDRHESIGPTLPSNRASQTPPEKTAPTFLQFPVVGSVQSKASGLSLISDSIERHPPTQTQGWKGIFGSEIRIVARQQGLKEKSRISVQFDIPETQFRSILNWINNSQDISSSICFTLGCYLTSELSDRAKNPDCQTFEAQVSSTRSVWPIHGGLSMNTNFNNSREDLPLSPPFQVTPDNLVDVSPFLVLGKNIIELSQRQDLSQYTFVLHAHYPTEAQLKQIEERRQKERAWNEWLHHISRPLKLPLQYHVQPTLIS